MTIRMRTSGARNGPDSTSHENWIWRSSDDGRTWSIVRTTTTHRHIHAVQVDRSTGPSSRSTAIELASGDRAVDGSRGHLADGVLGSPASPSTSRSTAQGTPFRPGQPLGGGRIQKAHIRERHDNSSALVMPGPSYSRASSTARTLSARAGSPTARTRQTTRTFTCTAARTAGAPSASSRDPMADPST